ncbi:MAG: hypothetical protein JRG76_09825 [Deltaproteobacteria bacterium]|nr:hypothetical protein [Deltaproteobacteria bacterium]
MRWLGIAAAAAIVIAVVLFLVVWQLVDPDQIGSALSAEIERVTGAEARLGEVDFSLFPLPSLRVRDVELHARKKPRGWRSTRAFGAREVRVSVSLFSALLGRVALTGLELEEPEVRLVFDDDGRVALPFEPAAEDASGGDGPTLAIHRVRVVNGSLELGEWRLEQVELEGSLGADLAVHLDGSLDVAGVGRLRDASVRVSGLLSDALEVEASGRLDAMDLAGIGERVGLDGMQGSLGGEFGFDFLDGAVDDLRLDLRLADAILEVGTVRIEGDVPITAEPGGRWQVDLGPSRVDVAGVASKPPQAPLSVSGDAPTPGAPLAGLQFRAGDSVLPVAVDTTGKSTMLELGPGALDLALLHGWLERGASGLPRSLSGRLVIDSLSVQVSPLALGGTGSLDAVEAGLQHGTVSLEGPWSASGNRLVAEGLEVGIADQVFLADLEYDVAVRRLALRTISDGAQLEPVLMALRGEAEITGALTADISLDGPPDLALLNGSGAFELRDGELRGFSILEQVMGELARLPVLLAAMRGRDLSKFDEERFEWVSAEFVIVEGTMRVSPLSALYRGGRVTLHGTIELASGALDLRGRIELSKEADEELLGEAPEQPTVIPIEGVHGTIARPRLVLDRDALAGVASTLATSGEVGEKLERVLGAEGAETMKQILEQMLKGGRR